MGKRYTLIVVDMQPFFSNDSNLNKHVALEIERARERACDILFVEIPYYSPMDEDGLEPTHFELRQLVKNYDKAKTVYKPMFQHSTTQAARAILGACMQYGFESSRFRVCGVNTGGWLRTASGGVDYNENSLEPKHTGCVFNIVLGLTKLAPLVRIRVAEAACKEEREFSVNWNDFANLPGVKVVSAAVSKSSQAA